MVAMRNLLHIQILLIFRRYTIIIMSDKLTKKLVIKRRRLKHNVCVLSWIECQLSIFNNMHGWKVRR